MRPHLLLSILEVPPPSAGQSHCSCLLPPLPKEVSSKCTTDQTTAPLNLCTQPATRISLTEIILRPYVKEGGCVYMKFKNRQEAVWD